MDMQRIRNCRWVLVGLVLAAGLVNPSDAASMLLLGRGAEAGGGASVYDPSTGILIEDSFYENDAASAGGSAHVELSSSGRQAASDAQARNTFAPLSAELYAEGLDFGGGPDCMSYASTRAWIEFTFVGTQPLVPMSLDGWFSTYSRAYSEITLMDVTSNTFIVEELFPFGDVEASLLLDATHTYRIEYVGYTSASNGEVAWWDMNVSLQVVPEPFTLSLLALGGLAVMRRRGNT